MENKIKEIREKKGISIQECSDATGISTRTIMRYEKGCLDHFQNLITLSDYYKVSLDDLLKHKIQL